MHLKPTVRYEVIQPNTPVISTRPWIVMCSFQSLNLQKWLELSSLISNNNTSHYLIIIMQWIVFSYIHINVFALSHLQITDEPLRTSLSDHITWPYRETDRRKPRGNRYGAVSVHTNFVYCLYTRVSIDYTEQNKLRITIIFNDILTPYCIS